MSRRVNESDQAEAVEGRTLDDVEAEAESASAELQALKAQSETLRQSIEEASAALDAVRLEELDRRARFLSPQIGAAQMRLHQLWAERARLQLPEAEAQEQAARAEYERVHAEYLQVYEQVNRLGVEADNARVRVLRLRQTAEENERQAQELRRSLPSSLKGALAGGTGARLPR